MIPYAKEIGAAVLLVALAASHGCVYRAGGNSARADLAKHKAAASAQIAHAIQVARDTERRQAQAIADISEQYERDKTDAQAKHDRVVADLRRGAVRLRDHWQGCAVPGTPASPGQRDEGAELRAADTGNLVRAGAECDAQIRAAQAVIEADRK